MYNYAEVGAIFWAQGLGPFSDNANVLERKENFRGFAALISPVLFVFYVAIGSTVFVMLYRGSPRFWTRTNVRDVG